MPNPTPHPPAAKMTIEVYTVTRDGAVTSPRTTVVVPHTYEPPPDQRGPQLPPCACPLHHPAPTAPAPLPSSTGIMRAYASWLLDQTAVPRVATTQRFGRDFHAYVTALVPATEHLARALAPDDIPAALALVSADTARRRLAERPDAVAARDLARVRRLAQSVVALCDHHDALTGVLMCLICDRPIEPGDCHVAYDTPSRRIHRRCAPALTPATRSPVPRCTRAVRNSPHPAPPRST
ncbi:DUF6415 family natural product biosynthesis protein [Streptomyces sp. NPDC048290]|uniref:DUF6415 family natural product biosynthesis protein n=1 Tax=Streptomyces sp. NPDC048290 TaxID=3155811 RepID=UPI003426113E